VDFTKQRRQSKLSFKEGKALLLGQVKYEEGKSEVVIFAKWLFYFFFFDMKNIFKFPG